MPCTALLWFRRDLRLADNPALDAALARCERVVPVYLHDPDDGDPWRPGAASRWWLHHALADLDADLRARGSRLVLRLGAERAALERLVAETGATHVFWNRRYEPALVERDRATEQALQQASIAMHSSNASLLLEPWTVQNREGKPYRVFTPFWKAIRERLPADALDAPEALPPVPEDIASETLEALALLPRIPWDAGLAQAWEVGEAAARQRLRAFLAEAAGDYADARDRPDRPATSRLSPYLHFGHIGPRQVVAACRQAGTNEGIAAFLRELGWRELSYHLLYHFPHTPDEPLDPRFARFPWREDGGEWLAAWQRGRTGYPMVDAGMRQLWTSGWMHNRARMLAASLLTKNLRIPWQAGARWFWDTLVDADLANNTQGWQWTAGCGADAAPYFRIFNPVRQGERFDPDGDYVRRWVPELARLPTPHIHHPWEAPDRVLAQAGVRLGQDYPKPIVDFQASRREALAAFETLRSGANKRR